MVLSAYNLAAYGQSYPTGEESDRGPAPGGLAQPMWDALVEFLASIGKTLTAQNYGDFFTDTFRTYAAQVRLKREKPGLAAEPGYSLHGIGCAVDWDNGRSDWPTIRAALVTTGPHYDLVHPFASMDTEEWHWQVTPARYKEGSRPVNVTAFVDVSKPEVKEFVLSRSQTLPVHEVLPRDWFHGEVPRADLTNYLALLGGRGVRPYVQWADGTLRKYDGKTPPKV